MTNFSKLNRLPYITKRMYIIKNICRLRSVDLDYLFGLFNLYNKKNSGRWFWQKSTFTGVLKDVYDKFNTTVDSIVKGLRQADEEETTVQINSASDILDNLLTGIEMNCDVNRENDFDYVKGFLDNNLKALINDSLKKIG